MKIFLLIYVIQGMAAHVPPDVQKIEQPSLAACYMREVEVAKQLRVDKCDLNDDSKPCFAPYLVRTACVMGGGDGK